MGSGGRQDNFGMDDLLMEVGFENCWVLRYIGHVKGENSSDIGKLYGCGWSA